MKPNKAFQAIMLSLCAFAPSPASGGSLTALPRELYMLPGSNNNIFTQAFLHESASSGTIVRFGGDCTFVRRIPSVATIASPVDGNIITVETVESRGFTSTGCDTVILRVAGPEAKRSGSVYAQIIGDSFVQGAFYRTALVDSCLVPGIHLVGLRRLASHAGAPQYDEGRGGWTLKDYFTINKDSFSPYAGFMQPADRRRYLGAREFWINCHRVASGNLSDFESRYQCGRFDDILPLFDPETGLPVKPAKNDLMWDASKGCYICFDGRRWRDCRDEDESSWKFDYSKYLAIWGLRAPDFLFETLGLNDFRHQLEEEYSEWDAMLRTMKDSYLEANPAGKFAIVVPCSSCGSMNNRRGDFTLRENECMWRFRRHLVSEFGNAASEGIHLVDMGITIDNEQGYRTDAEGLQTGNPHPYPNYPAMGMPLAAFIQYYRK